MTRSSIVAILVLLASAGCSSEPPSGEAAVDRRYFSNARVIRGDGTPAIEDATFVVEDGLITRLGAGDAIAVPDDAQAVDLGGRTVMPLLTSLHVHVGYLDGRSFSAEHYSRAAVLADLQRYAYHGVGAVAVLGSDADDTALRIRSEQASGSLADRARIHTAGRGITTEGGWPTTIPALADVPFQITTQQGARDAVRALFEDDVDLVKIWVDDGSGRLPKLAPDVYTIVIDEAHASGLPVVAHVFYADDARALVEAGVDGLVHSIRDRDVDDDLVAMMRQRETFYVPTLVAHETSFSYADAPAWVGEPAMRATVPAAVVEWLTGEEFLAQQRANPSLDALRTQYAVAQRNLKRLGDGGVTIALGTDSGTPNRFPGHAEHRELELMVGAGLDPQHAIAAGTRNGAAILDRENGGTLGAGKRADFIVVDGDPLADITTTRDIVEVSVDGHFLDRDGMAVRQPMP